MKIIDVYSVSNGKLKCDKEGCCNKFKWTMVGIKGGKKIYKRLCEEHYMNS